MESMSEHIEMMERASKLYRYEQRARRIVDSCVAYALHEYGEPRDGNYRRFAADVATDATVALLRIIYDGDGELSAMREERDRYKRLAEDALRYVPPKVAIAAITGSDD